MTSEGAIFRRAYGALDRVAPAAPTFAELGMARAVASAPSAPRRQLMMAASVVAVLIVAVVPVVLFSTNPGSFWSSQAPPTTSGTTVPGECFPTTTTIHPVATPTTRPGETPTIPPSPAGCDEPRSASTTTQAPGTTEPGNAPTFEPEQVHNDGAVLLTEFLVAMHEGRFSDAVGLLEAEYQGSSWRSGVFMQLEARHPEVDPNDLTGLLAASCETTPFCERIRNLRAVGEGVSSDPNQRPFLYEVMFEDVDGNPISWSSDDVGEPNNHHQFQVNFFQEQGFFLITDLSLPWPAP